jgi:hypothetical protein
MEAAAMTEYAEPQINGASGTAAYLVLVGVFATAIAAVVGFLFVVAISFPLSLFAVFVPSRIPNWLWNGAVSASPVTLVLLPTAVVIGRRHPIILYFALPLVGLIGGILAMKLWFHIGTHWPELSSFAKAYLSFELPFTKSPGNELLIWTGAIAGLVAGAFYSGAVHEMRR